MFFKYDKLLYYFMGNLVFKREGKGQQKKKKKDRCGAFSRRESEKSGKT